MPVLDRLVVSPVCSSQVCVTVSVCFSGFYLGFVVVVCLRPVFSLWGSSKIEGVEEVVDQKWLGKVLLLASSKWMDMEGLLAVDLGTVDGFFEKARCAIFRGQW
ncbi:hypothetical protein L6452_22747 [Arctium lappa]|uniref:Uncharacterized protein n=1 Tax=Arctium lappa TaxID=4217 RepID=A0ACB9B0Q5_ARCLA|nr:hypothetical protein L6452_22747 [Arctium lappa]